jgi:hypothetical protein
MNIKGIRTTSNLAMLEFVARKLEQLNDEVVFLGGCTTALFITDPLSLDVRPTWDVDCIIDVISLGEYHQFESKLNKQGFRKSMEDDVICRWRYDDIILDIMPTDEKILGFGNRWYKEAIKHAVTHQIKEDLCIQSVTAPYFLATKMEAFKGRGNDDYFASHDLEDIITVIDGRPELVDEVSFSSPVLKDYLQNIFLLLYADEQFHLALPGHLNDGPATQNRTQTVLKRIELIANLTENA